MRDIETIYDGLETPEWRDEVVKQLTGMVYEYLREEGLLRTDEQMADRARKIQEDTRKLIVDGEEELKSQGNNHCMPTDANIY